MTRGGAEIIGVFDKMVAAYNANTSSRFKRVQRGLPASGSSADHHYRSEGQYLQLIEMVRDFERNDPLIRGAFNRLTSNVVQGGFTLDVDTGDKDTDEYLTEKWGEWAGDASQCDAAGELTFPQQEAMAFRSMARDGDCISVGLKSGQLRWYEAHRLRTPKNTKQNVVHGVRLDELRRRVEYWFTREELNTWESVNRVSDMTRIPTLDSNGNRQVFHIYHPDRFTQTRGIGWAVPAVDTIGMHGDIQFAKMVQQKVVSCFSVFLKRTADWNPEDTNAAGEAGPTRQDYLNGIQRNLQELHPGKLIEGMPGEELQGFSPAVPNPEFFQHALLLLTFVACSLDLPLQVLLLDPTKTNFSGWRGAIEQSRLRFAQLQELMINRLHQPVYLWKVRQWLASDDNLQGAALKGGVNIFGHKWNAPGWDYIERFTDAQADTLMVAGGLDSRRRLLARRGLRHDQIAVELVDDNGLLIELAVRKAIALNETYGAKLKQFEQPFVNWHECAAMPMPQGVTLSVANQGKPPEPPAGSAMKENDE